MKNHLYDIYIIIDEDIIYENNAVKILYKFLNEISKKCIHLIKYKNSIIITL